MVRFFLFLKEKLIAKCFMFLASDLRPFFQVVLHGTYRYSHEHADTHLHKEIRLMKPEKILVLCHFKMERVKLFEIVG